MRAAGQQRRDTGGAAIDSGRSEAPAAPDSRRPRREKSLLARALGHLARREHSRAELARKLAPHAAAPAQLEALLDELQARKLLSQARFVESLARARGGFGAARVEQELRAHRIDSEVARATLTELRRTEFERARALWRRRYGTVASDRAERLRQMRFLSGRGFSAEVIRKVVGGTDED
jgi:regulatory protein